MKKQVTILVFLLTFVFAGVSAQGYKISLPPGYYKIQSGHNNSSKNIDGSPFLDEAWQAGTLVKLDGSVIDNLKYRYNVAGKQIQFRKDGQVFSIGSPFKIKTIDFGGRTFVYSSYKSGGKLLYDYFERVTEGDFQLLCRYEIELKPANYQVSHNIGSKNDTYIIKEFF